jgi:hypothetical protein
VFDFLRTRKKDQKIETSHHVLISRIRSIRAERATRIYSPNYSVTGIRALFRSILEYNRFLKQVTDGMKSPTGVNVMLFKNSPSLIYLRDWFYDSNGFYLDTEEMILQFQERSSRLIESYIELEKNPDPVQQKTLLHVGPVINQIREITDQLILVTQHDPKEISDSAIKRSGY